MMYYNYCSKCNKIFNTTCHFNPKISRMMKPEQAYGDAICVKGAYKTYDGSRFILRGLNMNVCRGQM
ncbi:hypothetical protein GE061_003951 [Apolygus lucorum]|uniref:Uncharacterized protein n=1 Tax=Apolygus lucorum TaxID=248454 RepID=A0A8S9WX99_APOLU|nr:hypothetical protein GE061_003951 [Apolygus lucorum]